MLRQSLVLSSLVVSAAIAASAVGFATAASPVGSKGNPVKATTSPSKGFSPKVVTVAPGSMVFFTNVDKAPHNAVHDPVSGKPKFTSGAATKGNFALKAPTKTGRYSYICTVHPFMEGTLVVKK